MRRMSPFHTFPWKSKVVKASVSYSAGLELIANVLQEIRIKNVSPIVFPVH